MCGIAGIYLKDSFHGQFDVESLVDGLLLGIESRGRDATGIMSASKGGKKVTLEKKDMEAQYFVQLRNFLPKNHRFSLLHTRLGTKGTETDMENNHPVNYKTCFAVHNGVIYNDDTLFEDLEVERVAAVDSIIVPTLVSECGGMDEALKSLIRIKGSWACAIADPTTNPDEVLLVRGERSPLIVLNHPKCVIWASTQDAIKKAWEMAIGTPPKHNKYTSLDEGEFVRIKGGGSVETGRFMEKRTYTSSSSFRTPHNYESQGHRSVYSGTAGRPASDRPKCFECGERMAFYSVVDSYHDTENERWVEWDVPVCFQCKNTDPKALTYRYATEKVSLRHRRDTQDCELCQYRQATGFDKNGTALCAECLDWKPQASFKGNDANADKFLTLEPGDLIPYNMRSAFRAGCESCSSNMVAYIGSDGFAICGMCKIAEDKLADSQTGLDCIQCDACKMYLLNEPGRIKETTFGWVCIECQAELEAEENDEEGEGCGVEVVVREKAVPNFLPYLNEADEKCPLETHFFTAVEQEISVEMGLHLPFVAWLISCCTADHLADKALTETWNDVIALYTRKIAEVV